MTKTVLAMSIVVMLGSCNLRKAEQAKLRLQIDSLKTELETSAKMAQALNDVGNMIDSIDMNRHVLHTKMVEGTPVEDFKKSMRSINEYVVEAEKKIADLEKGLNSARHTGRQYSLSIEKMKSELKSRNDELAALQRRVDEYKNENDNLIQTVSLQRSEIEDKIAQIEAKKTETAKLEGQVVQLINQSKIDQAEYYFSKASILEETAKRTKFAPRKKRNTNRQALDMYELAATCGKEEAVAKVAELKKKI
ncbi:MAG: hypothetical protein QM734_11735 [Cyclobacteriaceae bacterium]